MQKRKTIGFFSGTSAGFFVGSFFGGPQAGQPGLINSIILNLGNWQLHLHHWLFALGLLIFLFCFLRKKYNLPPLFFTFLLGFFIGLIAQGIYCYEDWHRILIR